MAARLADYGYILATIFFTVFGQLVLKWRLSAVALPEPFAPKIKALFFLLFDPYIFAGYMAAFFASLAWMAAIARFPLSQAYPFMSLNFLIVLLLSAWILSEPLSAQKLLGVLLIIGGTLIASRG